ncbi:H-protein subunit of glycine cleavage system [Spathaspora passalidarum NRRL Y-27907]|uniref:Glycine cleavage system H protein n=1 Tax=Spathaspora passalidarum (strain NRRL Y-27907 / 11-Y1) TaxID=619300 RepID=G3ANW9_SPAPN|nr:H-protein subunit of glycine cleavage system [Spathaspora passalidarum NRRL Y-27907]EGW32594.1 H-protein subunit of glycine cleavage system [Spathaspora passalidarum NRRL Y-27907]
MFKSLLRTTPALRRVAFNAAPRVTRTALFSTTRVTMNTISYKLNKGSHVYKYLSGDGPEYVKYTPEHEWLAVFPDTSAFVGITDYASEALGDVTYVELPEVGDKVEVGDVIGSVESVKSASEIYSPVAGEIVAVNTDLNSNPTILNIDPMGNGWIAHIKLDDPEAVKESAELMGIEEYTASLAEES